MDIPPICPGDPVDKLRHTFEAAFPYLVATEIILRKDVRETEGPDGWKTVEETGEFSCHIRARRRT